MKEVNDLLYGWWGKMMVVDLSKGSIDKEEIDEKVLKKYIGGRGLGAYLFVQHTRDPNVDPLSEKNPIILTVGPLTATPSPTAGRANMTSRSPLSLTIMDSNIGGTFGALMKMAGYDAVVITGKSPEPVYLYFDDERVEILPAKDLWGKGNKEVTKILKERHGKRASVLSIGRAGENLVRISAVMNNGERAFGRGGAGAIWGSKKLKAIVTNGGKQQPLIHSPEDFKYFRYEANKLIVTHPVTSKVFNPLGTIGIIRMINAFQILGTRNFQDNHFEGAEKISGETLQRTYLVRKDACWGCPIMCGRISKIDGKEGAGPEFETTWALGSNLGIDDLKTVTLANFLANDLGIDTISLGSVVAFAMEATEKGVFDFGIRFGEADKILEFIESIGLRRGFGDILAEGVKRASEKVGGKEFAMHVKGLEIPAYDPRGTQGMGLVYATSNRGACHLRGGLSVTFEVYGVPRRIDRLEVLGKGTHVARSQDAGAVIDSLIVCRFATMATSLHHWVRLYNAVTGESITASELQRIGERIYNLERMINLKLGFTGKDDTLPQRFLKEAKKIADKGEFVVDLDTMLKEYYEYRKWDENGIPTKEKLKELDLEVDIPWL
ncbi:MAG: aldehyde ferredoxin oxidoreductase [Thermotogae bacterium]|nr:MAG: aldehyde ferredoxin oxidoreductase [Thermotogota bacterium]